MKTNVGELVKYLGRTKLIIEPQVRVQPDVVLLPDGLGLALADERLIPQRKHVSH